MLEIMGLLFRRTNTFKLGLGIMLIILSLKDFFFSCSAAAQRGPWPPHS